MKGIQKKIVIVILIMLMIGGLPGRLIAGESKVYAANDNNWENVGNAGFSSGPSQEISLDVNGGTPYVAYRDSTYGNRLVVKRYNGIAWEDLGSPGFSDGSAKYISIFVYNGIPYVAYQDADFKATVKKYSGETWEDVGEPRFSSGSATAISLFVYDGTPYVAYRDSGNSYKATVMMFNGSSWENVGTAGFSKGRANNTSLYVYGGTPYVAYLDEANGKKATVKKYNGNEWEDVGRAGFSAGDAYETKMAVYNYTPYVLYKDLVNGGKATVMKYNENKWEEVGRAGFSQGAADNLSLEIYDDTLYVGYTDGSQSNKATVKKFTKSEWEDVGQVGFSAGQTHYNSLSIDEGTLYVAYRDMWNDYKATVMKFQLPTYTIAKLSDQRLSDLTQDYESGTQEIRTIQVMRTGTGDLNNLRVKLIEEDNSNFTITQPIATALNDTTSTTTFTVKAKDGLDVGTYTETVKVEADDMKAVTFEVTQEVSFVQPQTAKPRATPAGGAVTSGATVELTTETEGATIYYTTDGSEPTSSGTEYAEPIEITTELTIKAIAVKAGMTDSEMMEEHYTILPPEQVAQPVANPAGGAVTSGATVELTTETSGATIYYTTDASVPTSSGTEYSEPIEMTEELTIKAIAVKAGMTDSEMMEEQYTILPPEQVAQPIANPVEGEFASGTLVELTTATERATIYYTTDGNEPTSSSIEYTVPIEITEELTIKAIAVKAGMTDSEVMEEHYTIATIPELSNLTASAGDRSVTLKWDDVTGKDSVTYTVYQVEGSSAPADPANWKPVQSNITVNSYTVTGLTNNKTYSFAIKVNYAEGTSDFSNVTTATPRASGGHGGSGGSGGGRVLSGDAHLADLQVWADGEKLALSPAFASVTTEYTGRTGVEQVEIVVKEAHSKAKVRLKDKILTNKIKVDLEEGDNTFVLRVQAKNGPEKKYTLTITREEALRPSEPIEFTDIDGHWAEKYIKHAVVKGIVDGYPDGTFRPNNRITRAEFTVMLTNSLKLEGEDETPMFTDKNQISGWAKSTVANAVQEGIINGYEDGSFRPNDYITRAEMATMIARALKLKLNAHVSTGFVDDKVIPQWAKGAVGAIRTLGIVDGRGWNRFVPNETATRAEATVMVLRMLGQQGRE